MIYQEKKPMAPDWTTGDMVVRWRSTVGDRDLDI